MPMPCLRCLAPVRCLMRRKEPATPNFPSPRILHPASWERLTRTQRIKSRERRIFGRPCIKCLLRDRCPLRRKDQAIRSFPVPKAQDPASWAPSIRTRCRKICSVLMRRIRFKSPILMLKRLHSHDLIPFILPRGAKAASRSSFPLHDISR